MQEPDAGQPSWVGKSAKREVLDEELMIRLLNPVREGNGDHFGLDVVIFVMVWHVLRSPVL